MISACSNSLASTCPPRGVCVATIALAVFLCGCVKPPPAVSLSGSWPSEPSDFGKVTHNWTRQGRIMHYEEPVLEVFATVKSPEWRAALVNRSAKRERLSATEKAALAATHQKSAQEGYEVQLLVTTYDRRENDLAKQRRSIWSLSLLDDAGRRVRPTSVKRDRRPRRVIRSDFPRFGDFAEAYIARFPRDVELFRQGARRFSLIMSSHRGSVELVWRGK